jgi:hypothetical protein
MKRKLWICTMSAVIAIAAGTTAKPAHASVRGACLPSGHFCLDDPQAEKCCAGGCVPFVNGMTAGACGQNPPK